MQLNLKKNDQPSFQIISVAALISDYNCRIIFLLYSSVVVELCRTVKSEYDIRRI